MSAIISAKQREEAFRKDLKELLDRHRAELDITDDGKGFGMHSSIVVVSMSPEWDDNHNQITEYTEFRL